MNLLTDILKNEIVPKINIGTTLEPKGVRFDAGHYAELVARIDKKKSQLGTAVVYPLIWLVMDFKQSYQPELNGEYLAPRLQLFIVEKSDDHSSSLQRIETIFKPTLIPIQEQLIGLLKNSYSFSWGPDTSYDITLHPYAQGLGNKANLFNDTVDAIEISNLSLEVNKTVIC